MDTLKRIALTLVIIGAINWGLIGLFDFDLVATLLGGQDSVLSRIVYSLVGLAGLISIRYLFEPDREVNNRTATGRLNYGTEFGEEEDFSSIRKDDRDI
ncbi:DUF378 domain-containing protein [Ornithinibacillus halotolerans]|uniref:DUF378 domain-containing protein n=1 Tax=Ornithinibacillus halotolerans TaxID=1274357 RepID=A0A916RWN1_9BACI|nr:DUF378 domain-containing protein [Ornithinibacillus halotolerans]GGA74003.1 hypothetical protein GCM10008025_17180 [Ornithinibacillus halotolerans]